MIKLFVAAIALSLIPLFSHAEDKVMLTLDNTVVYHGEISAESTTDIENKLQDLTRRRGKKNYTIYLVMDSPGGEITSGEDFIQFVKLIPNLKTITLFSASMAAGIVESLPGERLIAENGVLMFHRAQGGFQGYFETGEVESRLDLAKQVVSNMERRNASRLGLSIVDYKKLVYKELWLYGSTAVDQKAADRQVTIQCSKALIQSADSVALNFADMFTVNVQFSGCPLLRYGAIAPGQDEALVTKYQNYIKEAYLKNIK